MTRVDMWITALLLLLPTIAVAEDEEIAEFKFLHVITDIRYRFAKTRVTGGIFNTANTTAEIAVDMTLPNSAYISDFSFKFNKRKYDSQIKEREAAEKSYTVAKAQGEAAGHVSQSAHETNKFILNLSVPQNANLTFNLTYEEVLQRRDGVYTHSIYIDPGQPVPDMKIDVAVQDTRDITTLKVPPIYSNSITDVDITENNNLAVVQRPTSNSAYIRFYPTLEQQLSRWAEGLSGVFSVMFDVHRGFDAGDLLVSNGYFIHFFAPAIPNPIPKDIVFILDTSTSMYNGKMDQLKAAMKVILRDLRADDKFNVISFSSRVRFWQSDMAEANNAERAVKYIDSLKSVGWTNIRKSLVSGLEYLSERQRSSEGALIMFLTDGRATSGERNPNMVLQNVRSANKKDIPVYTLAFGKDADWELVKKLALQNFGITRRIYTDGDPARQIQNFYQEVSSAMLHGVTFRYSDTVTSGTQQNFTNYLDGSELIVTGVLDSQIDPLTTNIIGTSASGPVNLKLTSPVVDLKSQFEALTPLYDDFKVEGILQRMHAYLYIRDLMQQRVGETDRSKRETLKQKALKLSLKYRFVTPFTSLVVDVRYQKRVPDLRRDEDLYFFKEKVLPTPPPYVRRYYGGGGGGGGSSRGGGGGDPHFMVFMEGLKYPVCFDVQGKDKSIYQLIHDPQTDLTVNARMGKGKKHTRQGGFRKYMMEIAIMFHDLHLLVTRSNISLHEETYSWDNEYNMTVPGARLFIKNVTRRITRLSVVFDSRFQIDIVRHIHSAANPLGGNFLNIELGNEELLSEDSDGIIGQFIHKKIRLQTITYRNGHLVGHLRSITGLERRHGRAHIKHRHDPVWNETVSCWSLREQAKRLFDAPPKYYIVDDMYQTTLS
ncbi:inter-alpha-trypsin inhibitor heavy chain H3-like isoform X1 [Haliotis rufescens]|uniref:inter-alpha-trypsin inhibitor heavy chain H3-like isoform X1 n=1 Tax=Haliotis rufescens TaxID=6454 RepID=UPI00201F4033|nr:inter-alpha-trypsin inhibitor heavy chain H3-like isoform X1 [Haliotis rufescens]